MTSLSGLPLGRQRKIPDFLSPSPPPHALICSSILVDMCTVCMGPVWVFVAGKKGRITRLLRTVQIRILELERPQKLSQICSCNSWRKQVRDRATMRAPLVISWSRFSVLIRAGRGVREDRHGSHWSHHKCLSHQRVCPLGRAGAGTQQGCSECMAPCIPGWIQCYAGEVHGPSHSCSVSLIITFALHNPLTPAE